MVLLVIWNKIGIAWHNLGELSLAQKSYEQALKVDKNYAEAINKPSALCITRRKKYLQRRQSPL